jgi:hypothetical protein
MKSSSRSKRQNFAYQGQATGENRLPSRFALIYLPLPPTIAIAGASGSGTGSPVRFTT